MLLQSKDNSSNYFIFLQKPACARLKTWECLEANGLVYVWYHIEKVRPSWTPLVLDQLDQNSKGHWVYQGRNEFEVDFKQKDVLTQKY